jgi:hypothetical protein
VCKPHDQEDAHKLDVEGLSSEEPLMESLGWTTNTKPAAEHGFRVNGVLCGPGNVANWKGTECLHDYTCPECGAAGKAEIDIIHSIENRDVQSTRCECRECGHGWAES